MASGTVDGLSLTKTLTLTGTMELDYGKTDNIVGFTVTTAGKRNCRAEGIGALGDLSIKCETIREVNGGTGVITYGVKVTPSFGATYTFPILQYASAFVDPASVDFTATLTWTIQVDVRLYCKWTASNSLLGTGAIPLYEGNELLEMYWIGDTTGSADISVELDNTVVSGSQTYSVSATASGLAFRNTGLGSGTDREVVDCRATPSANASTYDAALDYSTRAYISWSYATALLSTGATSYSYTAYSATQTIAYGVDSVEAVANLGAGTSGIASLVFGRAEVAPVREANLILDIFAFTDRVKLATVPEDIDVTITGPGSTTITATDGHATHSMTQRYERVFTNTGAWNNLGSNGYNPISAAIPVTWMSVARGYLSSSVLADGSYGGGFHFKDQRLTEVMSLELADSFAIMGGTDSAVTGGVRRTWTNKQSLLNYRYLSVSVGTALDSGGTIRIVRDSGATVGQTTSYEWTSDRDGAPLSGAGPFVIDLLCPSNRTVEVDATLSTWPEDTSGVAGIRRGEGWLTGPSWVDRLEVIGAVSGGGATTITGVSLVRAATDQTDRGALLSCLDQTGAWALGQVGVTTVHFRSFLHVTVDGRVEAVSETDAVCNQSGSTITPLSYSLTELIAALNHDRNPGTLATRLIAATGGAWHDEDLPSVGLLGAGWLWNATTQEWECTLDTPMTGSGVITPEELGPGDEPGDPPPPDPSSFSLDYQLGVREISFPANLGDQLFGHAGDSALTGPTTLVAYAMIHSQAYGVVVGESGVPEEVATIGVRTRTGTGVTYPDERGEDASDGLGYFATGEEWMRGFRLQHDAYSDDTSTAIFASPRRRQPVRFVSGQFPGLEILNTLPGWVALVSVEDYELRWRRWSYPVPMGATPVADLFVTTGHKDRQPSLFYWMGQRTYLLFWRKDGASGDGVYETYSDDDGDTWSTPAMSITGGQYPRNAVDISGGVLRAAWVADTVTIGNLKGTWQSPGDASPSAVFTFTELGGSALRVKKTGFDVSAAPDSASRINLTCTIEGESATSNWYSEDDGRNWVRS